ncbi:hypothetical protein [Cloacibacterium sp.]|uniref:hypothetical protein n=1 Tax=Cloacibacterium sp. TaxID=1913682 RepID=UPI0039E23887
MKKMNFKEVIKKLNQIENEIFNLAYTVVDGAIDNEKFLNNKLRITWFLKEPYSDEEHSWKYRDVFTLTDENIKNDEDLYDVWFKDVARNTWQPIIYVSYGILNSFKTWSEMSYIRENRDMCDVIQEISIINSNKNFSETGTFSLQENIKTGFDKFENIIKQQIELLNPNVLIFGNTFNEYYKKLLKIEEKHKVKELSKSDIINVYFKEGKIFLDVWHPSQRGKASREEYVNSIINSVKEFENKLNFIS